MTDDDIRTGDAWGDALLAFLDDRAVPDLLLDGEPGGSGPAMDPSWFFRSSTSGTGGSASSSR